MKSQINSNYVKFKEINGLAGRVWASFCAFSNAPGCFGCANTSLLCVMVFDILALRKVKCCMRAFESR